VIGYGVVEAGMDKGYNGKVIDIAVIGALPVAMQSDDLYVVAPDPMVHINWALVGRLMLAAAGIVSTSVLADDTAVGSTRLNANGA